MRPADQGLDGYDAGRFIVAGLNIGPDARAALRWAGAEAVRRRLPLAIVRPRSIQTCALAAAASGYAFTFEDVVGDQQLLDHAVNEARVACPSIRVTGYLGSPDPTGALLAFADRADLIVTPGPSERGGSRGARAAISRLARRSPAPVAIVSDSPGSTLRDGDDPQGDLLVVATSLRGAQSALAWACPRAAAGGASVATALLLGSRACRRHDTRLDAEQQLFDLLVRQRLASPGLRLTGQVAPTLPAATDRVGRCALLVTSNRFSRAAHSTRARFASLLRAARTVTVVPVP